MRSACEPHNLFRGCHRKTPSLALTAWSDKAPGLHALRGGLPASLGVALSNFGRGIHTRDPERRRPRPHPRSPLGFVPLQTHLPRAPKTTPPPPALPISLSEGTKERQEGNSRRGVPRTAHSPSSERGTEGLQSPQRHDSAALQRRAERHSPMRSPRGGGPQGAGFRGITVTPESGALVSGGTPVLNFSRLRSPAVTASQPRRRAQASRGGGSARSGERTRAPPPAGQGGTTFLLYRYRSRRWPSRTPLPPRLPLPLPPPPSWERVAAECCHPP